jgi:hypothetical protein
MYATMPKYVLRTVGPTASPEWIANVNPFVVMTCVMLITHVMKRVRAITSMIAGMVLMPLSALTMASSAWLESNTGSAIALPLGILAHPITVTLILGIVLQGLQAPKGEEGTYLGFSHLHSFFSSLLGFGISGYLLTRYCPDPKTLAPADLATAYAGAHVLWYYFAAIGSVAAVSLAVYAAVTSRLDRRDHATLPSAS